MPRDPRALLWDAHQAASKIQRFTAGLTYADYAADEILRSAVERQFEIVGEALGRLAKDNSEIAGAIPEISRIVGFRNVLIHGYASVDDELVWQIRSDQLPRLIDVLDRLLHDLHG